MTTQERTWNLFTNLLMLVLGGVIVFLIMVK